MSLSSLIGRRPKAKVEGFCLYFYARSIFHSSSLSMHLKPHLETLAHYDDAFAAVGMDVFTQEMKAVKMEVFALALTHRGGKHSVLLREAACAKQIALQNGLWDAMLAYNTAIASAAEALLPRKERIRRGKVAMVNT